MHTACKNCTKDNPEVNAGSPKRSRKCTKNRAETCDIEELNEKYLPRWQRDIVHTILEPNRRCHLSGTSECTVDNGPINKIADNERSERAKKCNHCLSLLPKT